MLAALLDGAGVRERTNAKRAMWQAYQIEGFARTKRLPDINAILRKMDPPRLMSAKEQHRSILAMARAMGATVEYRKRGS